MTRWKWTAAVLCCALLGGTTSSFAASLTPIVISPNYDPVVTSTAYLNMGPLGQQGFTGVPFGNFDFGPTPNPPSGPPARGVQDVLKADTIIYRRMDQGQTLNNENDVVTTTIDVVAVCLKSINQLDLGYGANYYYATLDTSFTNGGTMTIKGDGTWENDFTIKVDLRRGSKTGDVDASVTKNFLGHGAWAKEPTGPILTDPEYWIYKDLFDAITYDPNGDGEFFLAGDAFHDTGEGDRHLVVDLFSIPEPSTGLLLLAGGLAVVWRTRRSRVAA